MLKTKSLFVTFILLGVAPVFAANCAVVDVAQIDGRVHIKCEQAISDGGASIYFFAVPVSSGSEESRTASRFFAAGLTAIASGRPMNMWFNPGDTSGASYGCGPADCRKAWGFSVSK